MFIYSTDKSRAWESNIKRSVVTVKKAYRMKKTVSMKQFISEFGEKFSKHMKHRLMELGARSVLTRDEESNILDVKHVEHIKYDCGSGGNQTAGRKEYVYGEFIVNEGALYFSDNCMENKDVMQAPAVKKLYDSLDSEALSIDGGISAKKVDDDNIDCIIDGILEVCPEMSPEHRAIISRY